MTACHTKTDDERYCFLPASFEIFQISNAGVGETLSSNMFVAEATMQKKVQDDFALAALPEYVAANFGGKELEYDIEGTKRWIII